MSSDGLPADSGVGSSSHGGTSLGGVIASATSVEIPSVSPALSSGSSVTHGHSASGSGGAELSTLEKTMSSTPHDQVR